MRTEDVSAILDYTVTFQRETQETLQGVGKDYVRNVAFTDVLTLPENARWSDFFRQAVNSGVYYYRTYATKYEEITNASAAIAYYAGTNIPILGGGSFSGLQMSFDEQDRLILKWNLRNSDTNTEVSGGTWRIIIPRDMVILDNVSEGQEYEFQNEVAADESFHYSENQQDEDEVSHKLTLGAPVFKFQKLGQNAPGSYDFCDFATDIAYTLRAGNEGVVPYESFGSVKDELPYFYYLKPANMEAMFADTYGDALTITISPATLYRESLLPLTAREVTTTDGSTDAYTSLPNTGYQTEHRGLEQAEKAENLRDTQAVLTLKRRNEGLIELQVTYSDGAAKTILIGAGQTYPSLQAALDSIGYFVTNSVRYGLVWNLSDRSVEERIIEGGRSKDFLVRASWKNTLMLIGQDKEYSYAATYPKERIQTINYAYAYSNEGRQIGNSNKYTYLTTEMALTKSATYDGKTLTSDSRIYDDTVLDYTLTAEKRAGDTFDVMPLVDHMSGVQTLLAPVESNEEAQWADGLSTYTDGDGKQYYMLDRPGEYHSVWAGDFCADTVVVTEGENGLDTLIYWYLKNWSRSRTVKYKSLLRPYSYNGGNLSYSINNEAWLNDHQTQRLHANLFSGGRTWSSTTARFDKSIVPYVGYQGAGDDYCLLTNGKSVTYRINLGTYYSGKDYTITGSEIYDQLPLTIPDAVWEKADIDIFYQGFSSVTYEGNDASSDRDAWDISLDSSRSGRLQQSIRWKDTFRLTGNKEGAIYVTLRFPSDESWRAYVEEFAATEMENTFWLHGLHDTVYHDLMDTSKVRLQKGVFSTGNFSKSYRRDWYDGYGTQISYRESEYGNGTWYYSDRTDENSRLTYQNDGSAEGMISYYVTIYNSGETNLYLTELQDVLPKGFTFHSIRYAENRGGYGTAHSGNTEGALARYRQGAYVIDEEGKQTQSWTGATGKVTARTETMEDGREKVYFSLSNSSYSSAHGMYYLRPGYALAFVYMCRTNQISETEDIATNQVAMPFYDYAGAGVEIDGSRSYPGYGTMEQNNGECEVIDNAEAANRGLTGGNSSTQWLLSEVTVTRDQIRPGITKRLASKTDINGTTVSTPASAHPQDLLNWALAVENDSDQVMYDYAVTDIVQYPFFFEGTVTLSGALDGQLLDIERPDPADPDKITLYPLRSYRYYPERKYRLGAENLRVGDPPVQMTSSYYDWGSGVLLGTYTFEVSIDKVEDITNSTEEEKKYNEVLSIRFLDNGTALGAHQILYVWVPTRVPKDANGSATLFNRVKLNTCYVTPLSQTWDHAVNKGNFAIYSTPYSDVKHTPENTADDMVYSVRNSAPVTITFGHYTSSEKGIMDLSDPENKALSTDAQNYITLDQRTDQFRYTLSVTNSTKLNMSKLVLLDNLPEVGDHTVFVVDDPRYSAFEVSLSETPNFKLLVLENGETEAKEISPDLYTVEFSEKTTFGDGDWNLSTAWDGTADHARSIRLSIVDGKVPIPPDAKVSLTFDAKVTYPDDFDLVKSGTIAWNGFGYHYMLQGYAYEMEAAPRLVGVRIPQEPIIEKQLTDYQKLSYRAGRDTAFRFVIYQLRDEQDNLNWTGTLTQEQREEQGITDEAGARAYLEKLLGKELEEKASAFTVVDTVVEAGESKYDTPILNQRKKYQFVETASGDPWQPTQESFSWVNGEKYYIAEFPDQEEYHFYSLNSDRNRICSFIYTGAGQKLICVNQRNDWGLTLHKMDSFELRNLQGAVFALYTPLYEEAISQEAYQTMDIGRYGLETKPDRIIEYGEGDERQIYYLKSIDVSPVSGYIRWKNLEGDSYIYQELKEPEGFLNRETVIGRVTRPSSNGNLTRTVKVTNDYDTRGVIVLNAEKSLDGRSLSEGGFSFTIERVTEDAPLPGDTTATNDGDGLVTFAGIPINEDDIGKLYRYRIREIKGNSTKLTYDEILHYADVQVSDNGYGVPETQITYYTLGNPEDETKLADGTALEEVGVRKETIPIFTNR